MPVMEPKGRPHRNHGLFSDHYLNVTLPGRPDWAALAGEAERVMAEVSRVLEAYAPSQNKHTGICGSPSRRARTGSLEMLEKERSEMTVQAAYALAREASLQ